MISLRSFHFLYCMSTLFIILGTTPILSEAQINAVDKLNQQLNAKVSSKMKRNNDDDEEVLANFDLRSAPRAILHQGPLMKRSEVFFMLLSSSVADISLFWCAFSRY